MMHPVSQSSAWATGLPETLAYPEPVVSAFCVRQSVSSDSVQLLRLANGSVRNAALLPPRLPPITVPATPLLMPVVVSAEGSALPVLWPAEAVALPMLQLAPSVQPLLLSAK